MGAARRRPGKRLALPRSITLRSPWRYAFSIAAAGVVCLVYFGLGARVGDLAPWLIGLVLLAVGIFAGFRAWSLAIALSVVAVLGLPLLTLPAVTWEAREPPAPAFFADDPAEPGLVRLGMEYRLDALTRDAASDRDRVVRLTAWASARFGHSADNRPSRSDPLTILQEAAQGQRFRCVEYSIVLVGAARSVSLPARIVGLGRPDLVTSSYGARHVVAEIWLPDEGRWIMADAQWNALVRLDGRYLSAVEARAAFAARPVDVRVDPAGWLVPKMAYYPAWLAPYLYYFDYDLDQRLFVEEAARRPGRVVLTPVGIERPHAWDGGSGESDVLLHSPAAFYATPAEGR